MTLGLPTGFTKVTRAALQIKDRTIMPPDRNIFSYHVVRDGAVVVVDGVWGDYLRDVDMGIVVKMHAPLNDAEKTRNETIITDLYPEGIPDPALIMDPLLPY